MFTTHYSAVISSDKDILFVSNYNFDSEDTFYIITAVFYNIVIIIICWHKPLLTLRKSQMYRSYFVQLQQLIVM